MCILMNKLPTTFYRNIAKQIGCVFYLEKDMMTMLFKFIKLFFSNSKYSTCFHFVSRKVALVIILTRAGLGLDAGVLRKHYAAVLQLGLLPWVVECVCIGVTSHYLLHLPWIWGKIQHSSSHLLEVKGLSLDTPLSKILCFILFIWKTAFTIILNNCLL